MQLTVTIEARETGPMVGEDIVLEVRVPGSVSYGSDDFETVLRAAADQAVAQVAAAVAASRELASTTPGG